MDSKRQALDLVGISGYIGSTDPKVFTREGSITLGEEIQRKQNKIERFETLKEQNRERMFGGESVGHMAYRRMQEENQDMTILQKRLRKQIFKSNIRMEHYKMYEEPEYNLIFKKPLEQLETPYNPHLVHFGDGDVRAFDEVTRGSRLLADLTLEDTSDVPKRKAGYKLGDPGAYTDRDREGIFHFGLDGEREGIF